MNFQHKIKPLSNFLWVINILDLDKKYQKNLNKLNITLGHDNNTKFFALQKKRHDSNFDCYKHKDECYPGVRNNMNSIIKDQGARVFKWLLGIVSVSGNFFVLVTTWKELMQDRSLRRFFFFFLNFRQQFYFITYHTRCLKRKKVFHINRYFMLDAVLVYNFCLFGLESFLCLFY